MTVGALHQPTSGLSILTLHEVKANALATSATAKLKNFSFFLFFSCVCHYFVVPLQRIFIHYLQKLQILINSFVL